MTTSERSVANGLEQQHIASAVMPAHSASKDARGRAYVAGIHVFLATTKKGVDGRDKPGHDDAVSHCPARVTPLP